MENPDNKHMCLYTIGNYSGKRTLSKMNAFDFIITIALGSALAAILLSKGTALAEGVLALSLLVFFQYSITWLSVRLEKFQELIKSSPSLLLFKGKYLATALKQERITKEEIKALLRKKGIEESRKLDAVVLETDGALSVIQKLEFIEVDASSMSSVKRA